MRTAGAEVRTAELREAVRLSSTVRGLSFEVVDGAPFEWRAGQYIEAAPRLDPPRSQPFSIASRMPSSGAQRFEIAVGAGEDPRVSKALHELAVGGRIDVRGPFGDFVLGPERDLPILFVGAGTGLAPLRAMIQDLFATSPEHRATLVFGCRADEDLLWRSELHGYERNHPGFRFHPTLSRPGPGWNGRIGHVQDHLVEAVTEVGPSRAYVCGLSDMVSECVRQLVELHAFDPALAFVERY